MPRGMVQPTDMVLLMAAIRTGDREAFAELYRLTSPKLFAIALRILRHQELAEEVVQEAYVCIWRKAGSYVQERGHPMAWMTTIVRRQAIDRLRAAGARDDAAVSFSDEAVGGHVADLAPLTAADDLAERLRDCLERLRTPHRDAIVMAYWYGLTHDELAVRLKSPVGTVKSWVRRGLLALKSCLDDDQSDTAGR